MGLSREELWNLLDGAPQPIFEPLINSIYELEGHRELTQERAPHGEPWATSFHASAFPGDDPVACGRLAVYGLLDPPRSEPLSPFLIAMFELGSNLEHSWVRRLREYGVLLSADVTGDEDYQTGFTDEEHWLTGATDAIILPPHSSKAHVLEIKTTSHEKILKMLDSGEVPRAHGKYLRQIKTYIGMAHEQLFSPTVSICKKSGLLMLNDGQRWCAARRRDVDRPHASLHDGNCDPELIVVQPPNDGTLVYSSREEPLKIASFNVRYDPTFMAAGREKLARWRDSFVAGEIPEHPLAHAKAKWSVAPCDFCLLKRDVCKPDYQQKISALSSSNLIDWARSVDPTWNFDEKRAAVLNRWSALREEPTAA